MKTTQQQRYTYNHEKLLCNKIFKEVMKKIVDGKYIPMVDKIIPMEDIRDAHEFIENRMQMGKVVLVH